MASACASRLISHARRCRASSPGDRRRRISCTMGPGSAIVAGVTCPRLRAARPAPVPDLPLAVARAHEQDVALLGVGGVDDRDGVGLLEAGEEEEVGVLT